MKNKIHLRRAALVAGAMTATLLLPLLGSSPALAAGEPPITSIGFTDGTPGGTGDDENYAPGTDVSIVINGATTGIFGYTGCVVVRAFNASGGLGPAVFTTTNATAFTWTAGTNVRTLLPEIDLDPAESTSYSVVLFNDGNNITPAGTCDDIFNENGEHAYNYTTSASMIIAVVADPETMTLTGDPKIGSTVTANAKVPGSLIGFDFDLWVCPDETIYPDADALEGVNGDCIGPFIQGRTGDSTSFYLGYDVARDGDDPEAQDFWDAACGKFFIVHDYPAGGHSNWIGPIGCDDTAAELAATGADDLASAISIGGLAAMVLGGVLLVIRRNRAARIR